MYIINHSLKILMKKETKTITTTTSKRITVELHILSVNDGIDATIKRYHIVNMFIFGFFFSIIRLFY